MLPVDRACKSSGHCTAHELPSLVGATTSTVVCTYLCFDGRLGIVQKQSQVVFHRIGPEHNRGNP